MSDPNTRQGKRTPVTLKIKFKSETLAQFIERYAVDVSQGGIFIRTKEPLAVGTQMKFEFQLKDASPLIAGEGTVVWTRENDPSRPAIAPGMGVRFDRLAEGSQQVLERILSEKAKQAPRTGDKAADTKPPMFTDSPTKVTPSHVTDALFGGRSGDSEQTPLPKPMPFHGEGDDADKAAAAFEEQTKVRSLDELAAATAGSFDDQKLATVVMPPDELAARRHQLGGDGGGAPASAGPLERDSAPVLPSPPEAPSRASRASVSPTPPTPVPAITSRPSQSGLPAVSSPVAEPGIATKIGVSPARAVVAARPSAPAMTAPAVGTAASAPATPAVPAAPDRPSSAPIVIGIVLVVLVALGAGWYFFLRDAGSSPATPPAEPAASPTTTGAAVPPGGVDTVIASSVANATVTVMGAGQRGDAPFTAHLEKDKAYQVRVTAPGYATVLLDVKGGQDKVTATLTAKPHVLEISSTPPGAQVVIDNTPQDKTTPIEVELTAAQAAKPKLHVVVKKAGFKPVDQMVDPSAYVDEESRIVWKLDAALTPTGGAGASAGGAAAGSGGGASAGPSHPTGATSPSNGAAGSAAHAGAGSGAGGASGASEPPAEGSAAPATTP